MGGQKISLDGARDILEHLEKALALLDFAGQQRIAVHVQMAIDLLQGSVAIEAAPNGTAPIVP
ncbi:hypothetical protein WBP06_07090 [Novosphingobium sp. BL-8H]|uniref:hypothetical protein n=1 Tax=Novosphingobium sp. BL-8H TaxID=3127640 RepID=UPI0037574576